MLPNLAGLELRDVTGAPGDGSNVGDQSRPFPRAPSFSFGPLRARRARIEPAPLAPLPEFGPLPPAFSM